MGHVTRNTIVVGDSQVYPQAANLYRLAVSPSGAHVHPGVRLCQATRFLTLFLTFLVYTLGARFAPDFLKMVYNAADFV
jgi:hypothetical protein